MNRQKIIEILKQKAIKNNPFDDKSDLKNPYCQVPEIKDNKEWLEYLYKNILNGIDENGVKYWLGKLSESIGRIEIEEYFRKVALSDNQKENQKNITFDMLLNKEDKGRVLVVIPESAGDIFLITSLFKSIKERYPEWALYVATKSKFKNILDGNPYVNRWIEYIPQMDNLIWLEGNSTHDGYFDVAYLPHIQTQRTLTYLHNGKDKIDFDLYK